MMIPKHMSEEQPLNEKQSNKIVSLSKRTYYFQPHQRCFEKSGVLLHFSTALWENPESSLKLVGHLLK